MKSQRFFHFGRWLCKKGDGRLIAAAVFCAIALSASLGGAAADKATGVARVRALTPTAQAVLVKIEKSLSPDGPDKEADKWLKQRPRKELISALREGLSADTHLQHVAANGAVDLKANELLPELLKLAKDHEDWQILSALEVLSRGTNVRPEVDKLLLEQLKAKSSAMKAVVFGALEQSRTTIPADVFDRLLSDPDGSVRELAVQHFLVTRELLPVEEQLRRFKAAFIVKPYQARRTAFIGFEALTEPERLKLASAYDSKLCVVEQNADVKAVCERISTKLKKGAK